MLLVQHLTRGRPPWLVSGIKPAPVAGGVSEKAARRAELFTKVAGGVAGVLSVIVGNVAPVGAGLASQTVNAGIKLIAASGIAAFNRYQFKKALKEIKALIDGGEWTLEDIVSACVESGQWTKDFGDKISKELADYTTRGEGQDLGDLIKDDIAELEKDMIGADQVAQDAKDQATPMTVDMLNKLNEKVLESRQKRLVKCSVCHAVGVNAGSHYNEKSVSYGKHDHSKDAAFATPPRKSAAAPSTSASSGGVKLEAMTNTPGKSPQPRCQAINAGGEHKGMQCTAPAKDGAFCGHHSHSK